MIQIQLLKDKSIEELIKCFGIDEGNKLSERIKSESFKAHFVVYDRDVILGICQFEFIDPDTALIDGIYITPAERKLKLGDGLLRATLNSIEIKGGSSVIFIANEEEHSFYQHYQFEDINIQNQRLASTYEKVQKMCNGNHLMHLSSISEFFNQPCKGSIKR